jgi:hypothetical protein
MVYALFLRGGSIGEARSGTEIIPYGRFDGIFQTREEAQVRGRRYVSSFSGGRRNYYHPRFSTVDLDVNRNVAKKLETQIN